MIRAVLFDLDDTLYPVAPCARAALEGAKGYAVREAGLPVAVLETEYDAILREQRAFHAGTSCYHSRSVRFQVICERLGLPLHHVSRLASAYWSAYLGAMSPFPDLPEVLGWLRSEGLRLGIGSNMTADWQLAKLERLGLIDSFDFIVTSEEAGVEKPAPGFFRLCVKKAGVSASECLFIGDHPEYDVLGAKSAGLKALRWQPDPLRRPAIMDEPLLDSFRDLPGRIRLLR